MRAVDASFFDDNRSHPEIALTHRGEKVVANVMTRLAEPELTANS
jgi:hypothetical protein